MAEVEQGEALEHPRWRGSPELLTDGRGIKIGTTTVFSDEVGAPAGFQRRPSVRWIRDGG
jgi:hypothetical protein